MQRPARRKNLLEVRRDWELQQARKMRGECDDCGHQWRPRNPSHQTNRCPGCGLRGTVTFSHIDVSEVVEVPATPRPRLGFEPTEVSDGA